MFTHKYLKTCIAISLWAAVTFGSSRESAVSETDVDLSKFQLSSSTDWKVELYFHHLLKLTRYPENSSISFAVSNNPLKSEITSNIYTVILDSATIHENKNIIISSSNFPNFSAEKEFYIFFYSEKTTNYKIDVGRVYIPFTGYSNSTTFVRKRIADRASGAIIALFYLETITTSFGVQDKSFPDLVVSGNIVDEKGTPCENILIEESALTTSGDIIYDYDVNQNTKSDVMGNFTLSFSLYDVNKLRFSGSGSEVEEILTDIADFKFYQTVLRNIDIGTIILPRDTVSESSYIKVKSETQLSIISTSNGNISFSVGEMNGDIMLIKLINPMGKIAVQKSIKYVGAGTYSADFNSLSAGNYILSVSSGVNSFSKKIGIK